MDEPIVLDIDHIYVSPEDPVAVFDLLAETLELPSLPFQDTGVLTSGAVRLGNLWLEVVQWSRQNRRGISFRPVALPDAIAYLEARALLYDGPEPHLDSTGRVLWTNVGVETISSDLLSVFMTEFPNGDSSDSPEVLTPWNGGSLGVVRTNEVEIVISKTEPVTSAWRSLLAPWPEVEDGVWEIGDGPRLRLTVGESDRLDGITLEVADLDEARRWLSRHGMLHSSGGKVLLNEQLVAGLKIQLVQASRSSITASRSLRPPTLELGPDRTWPAVRLSLDELGRYAGTYEDQWGVRTRVWVEAEMLRTETVDYGPLDLVPMGAHRFAVGDYREGRLVEIYWPDEVQIFEMENQRAVGYRVIENGETKIIAERVDTL